MFWLNVFMWFFQIVKVILNLKFFFNLLHDGMMDPADLLSHCSVVCRNISRVVHHLCHLDPDHGHEASDHGCDHLDCFLSHWGLHEPFLEAGTIYLLVQRFKGKIFLQKSCHLDIDETPSLLTWLHSRSQVCWAGERGRTQNPEYKKNIAFLPNSLRNSSSFMSHVILCIRSSSCYMEICFS